MDDLIPEDAETGVAVFAHPDDESLWCGGLLARNNLTWTVICCTVPYADPIRAYKFFLACEMLKVSPRILPFSERDGPIRVGQIDLDGFDVILTHGAKGEYGHCQHVELHNWIRDKYHDRVRRYIGYGGAGRFSVPLTESERAIKMAAIHCYDHVSPTDGGKRKGQALIDYYGQRFDLWTERYD